MGIVVLSLLCRNFNFEDDLVDYFISSICENRDDSRIKIGCAARETRTLNGNAHLALNQACLPISAWPHYASEYLNDNDLSS